MKQLNAFIAKLSDLQLAILAGLTLVAGWSPLPTFFLLFYGIYFLLQLEDRLQGSSNKRFTGMFYLAFLVWNLGTTWWVYKASLSGAIFMLFANSLLQIAPWALYRFSRRVVSHARALTLFVCYYIGVEYFLHVWDLSWPWLTLGNTLGSAVAFAQFYEFTGVAGGSLWILLVATSLFHVIRNGKSIRLPLILAFFPAVISLIMFFFVSYERGQEIKVGLIQPNFEPHNEKFELDPMVQLDTMISQMESLSRQGAQLMVLPETALVGSISEDYLNRDPMLNKLKMLIRKHPEIAIIGGCDSKREYDHKATSTAREFRNDPGYFYDVYNTAFYLDSNGLQPLYHKAKLVPGTEIMPYPGLFSFLDKVMVSLDGTPNSLGRDFKIINYNTHGQTKIAPNICYESIYGDWTAKFVRGGAQFIAIMSNDGWWGKTYGYRQLLQYGQLRAIENRRWIARSGNTGISAVISPKGVLQDDSDFWTRDAILSSMYARSKITLFTRLGDYLNKTLLLICLFVIPSLWVKWFTTRRKTRKKSKA